MKRLLAVAFHETNSRKAFALDPQGIGFAADSGPDQPDRKTGTGCRIVPAAAVGGLPKRSLGLLRLKVRHGPSTVAPE